MLILLHGYKPKADSPGKGAQTAGRIPLKKLLDTTHMDGLCQRSKFSSLPGSHNPWTRWAHAELLWYPSQWEHWQEERCIE